MLNNPGGLLDQAVKVSDEFLNEGLIVYTGGRLKSQDMRFEAHMNTRPHS
ncbi:MAG: peptidase S41, partial [Deltaproteobacteria bacterium]|nr:peptidase S41 [Deltaproteobacteria bacterium]